METKKNTARDLSHATELLRQVRSVNHLIQGVCSRTTEGEISVNEAEGLWVMLDWQNASLRSVAAAIENVQKLQSVAATSRAS